MQNDEIQIMVKYDNYYIDKSQYEMIYSIIDDTNILQPINQSIKHLTTYEFISYRGIIMYKLEINVIDKLEELEYNIKFVDELDQYKEIKNKLTNNGYFRILYEKSRNTVNEIYKQYSQ